MGQPLHERFPLLPGSHPTREHGMCAMEMVAWLAGEQHSDEPECVCPTLASIVRTFNDVVPDVETRNRYVRTLVPRLIHTESTSELRERRAYLALDCAVRFFASSALAANGQLEAAETVRQLDEIRDAETAARAAEALEPFGRAVHAARWTARRAASGVPHRLWISGVVHAAKETRTWQGLRRLIESMIELQVRVAR